MSLSQFENLLKETSGLDAASIGPSVIERAVRERISACHLKDVGAYWERVHASETETSELIEAVVVPETWFFRDPDAFATLARLSMEDWLPAHPGGSLRLLSLPCSSGEEPYSMAMALLEAGFPAGRFSIDAVDISKRSVARAQAAVYGKNAFRSRDLSFRDRYFEATPAGHKITESVRRQVHFKSDNLFDPALFFGSPTYDVIFCRNLLIYFDEGTQDRAVNVLAQLLAADGLLFVGPAETSLLLKHQFVSLRVPMSFGFRKILGAPCRAKELLASPCVAKETIVPATSPTPAPIAPPAPFTSLIDEAQTLADQGYLAEAANRCEEFLKTNSSSAKVYYLLGLVRDAENQPAKAAELYRKTLYLEPGHANALLHWALLLEKQGDRAGAKVLHERRHRTENTGAS